MILHNHFCSQWIQALLTFADKGTEGPENACVRRTCTWDETMLAERMNQLAV